MTIGGPVGVDMRAVKARKDAISGASREAVERSLKTADDFSRPFQELLKILLTNRGLPQPGLHALHAQREEHHQQRHEDGQPCSHRGASSRTRQQAAKWGGALPSRRYRFVT